MNCINFKAFAAFFLLLAGTGPLFGQAPGTQAVEIALVWKEGVPSGAIEVSRGMLQSLTISAGQGTVEGNRFTITGSDARLQIGIADAKTAIGPEPTVVHVQAGEQSFSFFLRDVQERYPIVIPQYGVAVLPAKDARTYKNVVEDVQKRATRSKLQAINGQPEVSFDGVAGKNRNMSVPTWLGISRDMRFFELSSGLPDSTIGEANIISPRLSHTPLQMPETGGVTNYLYVMGRGVGVRHNVTRRLDQGALPILTATLVDDDVEYRSTALVALEKSPLKSLKGTDSLVTDRYSYGHMFSPREQELLKTREPAALNTSEETVLFCRTVIENRGTVPRYAWFKTPRPGNTWHSAPAYSFDAQSGYSQFAADKIFCISRANGKPLPNEELALLLPPGETAIVEFCVPHRPISKERADQLAKVSFDDRLEEARAFWQGKLKQGGSIHVPEQRIDEMIRAGLLHLDLITYGNEPDGTLAANVGVYSPIGTESSPIIQFYASMGWTDQARRALNYFLENQYENGLIQNFGGYGSETQAVLWSLGEYFRYTNDIEWVKSVKPKLIKSCDYLIAMRNAHKRDELKGRGYGMISGKVADPEDHFHQFMLNGYAYLGLSRVAEMLKEIDPAEHQRIKAEADAWRADIRESFFCAMARSPVIPLGDGTWCPTVPPWTEANGPAMLFEDRGNIWTHGTFTARDAILGPLYLVFCEVLDPTEPAAKSLLRYHSELFYQANAAFSQPYYSRHNWLQMRLGMVKPFLATYYNTVSADADRETYTFWEHLYKLSPHKTHEEAWFLMETRWMLYAEEGTALHLFKTIPRKWLEDGKTISLDGVRSYFGKLNVRATSHVGRGEIEATIGGEFFTKPETVTIRLPHPEGKQPKKVVRGEYDAASETVTIKGFTGEAKVVLQY